MPLPDTDLTEDTVLLVIDMQNGFCHPDGSFGTLDMDVSMTGGAIAGCKTLVAAAREAGVPVVWTRYVYRPDYADGGVLVADLLPAIKDIRSLEDGTWDAEIVDDLPPAEGEEIIDKNRYSAFYGTRLEPYLTSQGIRNIVLCGVTTNMCVETSARDAAQRDYRTVVVSDATGELEQARHEHALTAIGFGFGWVASTDDVVGAWS
ncbi:cysteine hydrolase family protein [Euzebya tangerina]|uniref:cysteine hydrolase family protein n=1 Tax=Euzebya tangerina TaxID=591198 RepID=UPI000E31890C|nr:isochorismatase family cysteine hydrolase [Euzebya tangerina]